MHTKVEDDVFSHDPLVYVRKSLVVVYRYGRNPPLTKVAPEDEQMLISKIVHPPYAGLVDTNKLLNDGDILILSAVNGKSISYDSNNMLVAIRVVPDNGCTMTAKKGSQNFFKIQCNNGQYVMINTDAGLVLYATGSAEEATKFSISISVKGGLRLASADKMYVHFNSEDSNLRANSVDHFGAGTILALLSSELALGYP